MTLNLLSTMVSFPIREVLLSICTYILLPVSFLVQTLLVPILEICFRQLGQWIQALDDRTESGQRRIRERKERDAIMYARPPQVWDFKDPPDGVTRDEFESTCDFTGRDWLQPVNCFAHEDGKSLVICSRDEDDRRDAARHMARVYDVLFGPQPYAITDMQSLEGPNPRIVRRVCNIRQGLRLERPGIGSLGQLTMPNLIWEASATPDWVDLCRQAENDLLSLYYRWALHAISAIDYCHRKGVYLQAIEPDSFWLESDFSLVLAGLAQAQIPAPEYVMQANDPENPVNSPDWMYDFDKGKWYTASNDDGYQNGDIFETTYGLCLRHANFRKDEPFMFPEDQGIMHPGDDYWANHMSHNSNIDSSAKEDIFEWANFVMRLFMNVLSKNNTINTAAPEWSLCTHQCPETYHTRGLRSKNVPRFKLHDEADWLFNLRPEQLREVVSKAWRGDYESASEVLVDLRQALKALGREVDDHNDIPPGLGRSWSEIFTIIKGEKGEYRCGAVPAWAREIKFVAQGNKIESDAS